MRIRLRSEKEGLGFGFGFALVEPGIMDRYLGVDTTYLPTYLLPPYIRYPLVGIRGVCPR